MISETASQNTTVSFCFDLPALETQDMASCQTVKICVDWFNQVAKHGRFLIKSKYSFIVCPRTSPFVTCPFQDISYAFGRKNSPVKHTEGF